MNIIKKTFLDNIEDNKPVFFHLLDGYINKDIGNTTEKTFDFMREIIVPVCSDKNILISHKIDANTKHGDNLRQHDDWIEFLNLKTNRKTFLFLNPETDEIAISENSDEFQFQTIQIDRYNTFEEVSSELLELFRFNIFQMADELHATSLLTFVKDNLMYMCIVNSGEGIDSNSSLKKFSIDGTEYYSPHFSFLICDDVQNQNKLVSALKSIVAACYFHVIYDEFKVGSQNCTIDNDDKYYLDFYDYNKYLKLLKFIIRNCEGVANMDYGISLEELSNKIPTTLYGNYNDEYVTERPTDLQNYLKYEYLVFDTIVSFRTTLYKMVCNIFINKNTKLIINHVNPTLFKTNVKEIFDTNNINSMVLNKIVFNIDNSEIYIVPQEGGTCTWYSMYWPLLMYHIYFYSNPNILE